MSSVYMVYGISDCPACLRVCADLMDHYPAAEYIFINCDFSKEYRRYVRDEKFKWPTFPIVAEWRDEREIVIGGSEELTRHLQGN